MSAQRLGLSPSPSQGEGRGEGAVVPRLLVGLHALTLTPTLSLAGRGSPAPTARNGGGCA